MNVSLTHTQCAGDVSGVTSFADTVIGAQCVDALAVLAQVPHHTTLINIWTKMIVTHKAE